MSRLGAALSLTLRREPADFADSRDGARASENGHGEGIVTATWLVLSDLPPILGFFDHRNGIARFQASEPNLGLVNLNEGHGCQGEPDGRGPLRAAGRGDDRPAARRVAVVRGEGGSP